MEPVTTYIIKGKQYPTLWEFRYDLNGLLTQFKVVEGTLTEKQTRWLGEHFPFTEKHMQLWTNIYPEYFDFTVGEPDLSFETFWNTYNHKVKKVMAENAWKRLSNRDKMEALAGIKPYNGYLHRKGIAKAHPSTYLNQRYWEDNYGSIH